MITTYYSDLTLLGGGSAIQACRPIELRGRDYYCLQYNHAGSIEVTIDDRPTVQVQGPSLLLTTPQHDYIFGNREGWHHNYVAFSGPRVRRYIESGLLQVERPLQQIRDSRTFLARFGSCIEALRERDQPRAAHALEGLLLALPCEGLPPSELLHHAQIRLLTESMRRQPARCWDLAEEAERLGLSLVHLRRLFKRVAGEAPGRFLLQSRLALAADLLTGTLQPIKQIAGECGLGNVHYFTRIFRRQYHRPPGQFRREFLGDTKV